MNEVTLEECPIGLFTCGGELCLKTEYGSNEGRIDAYIVSSGEFFWGGSNGIPARQREVMVTPVDASEVERSNPVLISRLFHVVRAGSAIVRFIRSDAVRPDEDGSAKAPTRIDDLRALTYAIEAVATDDGWLPIDTMPDVGRFVVKGPSGFVAPHNIHIESVHRNFKDGPMLTDDGDHYFASWPSPTHWMPAEAWL